MLEQHAGEEISHAQDESDKIDYEGLQFEFEGNEDALELLRHLRTTSRQEARAMVVGCLRELADMKQSESNAEESVSKEKLLELQQKTEKVVRAYEKKIARLKTVGTIILSNGLFHLH
jgi:ribosomal protein L29